MPIRNTTLVPYCKNTPYSKKKYMGLMPRHHVIHFKFMSNFKQLLTKKLFWFLPYHSYKEYYLNDKLQKIAFYDSNIPFFLENIIDQIEKNGYYNISSDCMKEVGL